MKIVFTGDVFLGGDMNEQSASGAIRHPTFEFADLRVVNLEQAISDSDLIVDKGSLYTDASTTEKLNEMRVTAVGLANNHIHDKGLAGILETIANIEKQNIGYFGAGYDISSASKPYWLTDKIAIFGYCEFGKNYLQQVEIASTDKPGCAPLRTQQILEDLNTLPDGTQAVLFLHWGREHVWFPPADDIDMARRLLTDERVLLIVGMHAHRIQGYIEVNGKRAYMCAGNFLFPNFHIAPPKKLTYPTSKDIVKWSTWNYHDVVEITYKKWGKVSRLSLLIELNTLTKEVKHAIAEQLENEPVVTQPSGLTSSIMLFVVEVLSLFYRLPRCLYVIPERVNRKAFYFFWFSRNRLHYMRQIGLKAVIGKAYARARKFFE